MDFLVMLHDSRPLKKIYMNFDLKYNDLTAVKLDLKVYVILFDLLHLGNWKYMNIKRWILTLMYLGILNSR